MTLVFMDKDTESSSQCERHVLSVHYLSDCYTESVHIISYLCIGMKHREAIIQIDSSTFTLLYSLLTEKERI